MNITADLFASYLKCQTKCFLRAHGETGSGNDYADWLRTENEACRVEGLRRMAAGIPPGDCVTGVDGTENLKTVKWRFAVDFPARAQNMESRIHAVERIPPEGRGRAAQFIPIRFIFTNKLSKDDKLLVAYDALVLSEMSGRAVSLGKIIHGDDHATLKVKTASLRNRVAKLTEKIAALLSADNVPDLVLNRHCGECEFQVLCRQKAIEKDDLSLLSGMAEKERKQLNSKGIFTVSQLSYTFRPRRRPKHLAAKRELYHHSLKALAIRENRIHIVGNPRLNITGTPVFLDVEGLPDRDFYYLIGMRTWRASAQEQLSLWADARKDEQTIWIEFLRVLRQVDTPVLMHYGNYETTFLRRMSERYPNACGECPNLDNLITAAVNVLSFIYGQVYFRTYSSGLKDIVRSMGFRWPDPEMTGLSSMAWRYRWETSRTDEIRQRLVTYNEADCRVLGLLTDVLTHIPDPNATLSNAQGNALSFVSNFADQYSYPSWRKFASEMPDLQAINEAAQWDYQRNRIHLRTTSPKKKDLATQPVTRRPKGRADKVILFPERPVCAKCRRKSTERLGVHSRVLHDILFGRSSVKRRVLRHDFQKFRCPKCRGIIGRDMRFYTRQKFGRSLIALYFYLTVDVGVLQQRAVRIFERLFNVTITTGDRCYLREKAAAYYQPTTAALLRKIACGHLVHVDETRARIHGNIGYVWVFTNCHEVVYLYSASREAEILLDTLRGFEGVLFSDFYSAYDSIDCSQQKCLIHLMRDLNNELLAHPYDEELRQVVHGFAALVRPMIDTIDRYGLKARHLRKHLQCVDRFYRNLARAEYQSEFALKFKERFEKNREKLFTFLQYDGVPWNNNAAEHAIKAYASVREVAHGTPRARATSEHLVLLSIRETCKNRGIDFLDFLRSGETDIDRFAKSIGSGRRRLV